MVARLFIRFFVPALLAWLPVFAYGYHKDVPPRRGFWLGAWVTTTLATVVVLTVASLVDDIVSMP
jgi:hypothetical protein